MPETTTHAIPSLSEYVLLGRSGVRVSSLCLGTMTFGTEWGWGSPAATARRILDRYLEAGGNFIDTADGYTNGKSEELLGEFLGGGLRERVVLATKFTFSAREGDPNAGGNSRKNMMRALEGSLRRLRTDYVDLYWLHAWDTLTPVEEVMAGLDSLVRAGKVTRPGVASTIIGATKMEQLEDNLRALDFRIPPELSDRLEEVSRPEPVFPYIFFSPGMQAMITGGTITRSEPPWFRGR